MKIYELFLSTLGEKMIFVNLPPYRFLVNTSKKLSKLIFFRSAYDVHCTFMQFYAVNDQNFYEEAQMGALLNVLSFLRSDFYLREEHSSRPKIGPPVNFSNFQAEEDFFIFKISGTSQ